LLIFGNLNLRKLRSAPQKLLLAPNLGSAKVPEELIDRSMLSNAKRLYGSLKYLRWVEGGLSGSPDISTDFLTITRQYFSVASNKLLLRKIISTVVYMII